MSAADRVQMQELRQTDREVKEEWQRISDEIAILYTSKENNKRKKSTANDDYEEDILVTDD